MYRWVYYGDHAFSRDGDGRGIFTVEKIGTSYKVLKFVAGGVIY